MRRWVLFLLAAPGCERSAAGTGDAARWYRGNTHTHTLWSDGDGAPEVVADWYKSHGYNFLVLSDHNILSQGEKWVNVATKGKAIAPAAVKEIRRRFGESWVTTAEGPAPAPDPNVDGDAARGTEPARSRMRLKPLRELRPFFEEPERFLFIEGEEITDKFGKLPIHHNSINHDHLLRPPGGSSVREVLERTVRAVEEEARRLGRPVLVHLNHPNFGWGVTPEDIAHVMGERFFEVYNGHPAVRNYGDAQHMGTEAIWDYVLAMRLSRQGGEVLYALATDDAHHYASNSIAERARSGTRYANPGRGWIMVRARELTADSITRAILAGEFYATTGVRLESVESDGRSLTVRIAAEPGVVYRTRFLGARGTTVGAPLAEVAGPTASYTFAGDELYVRATVLSDKPHPNGYAPGDLQTAWVQPVRPRR